MKYLEIYSNYETNRILYIRIKKLMGLFPLTHNIFKIYYSFLLKGPFGFFYI